MSVRIFIDSTCDLPAELRATLPTVALTVRFGDVEYRDGVDFSMPLLLGYTGVSDELLRQYIEDSAHLWRDSTASLSQTPIGSVIGTHAGPGAVAVAFFCGK